MIVSIKSTHVFLYALLIQNFVSLYKNIYV